MYLWSNKKDLNQKSRRSSKNERFLAFWWKTPANVFHRNSARAFRKPSFSELRGHFSFKSFLLDTCMFVLAEGMIFTSAECFFLHRRRVLENFHFFCLYGSVQNQSKKALFSQSRCRHRTGRGGCV